MIKDIKGIEAIMKYAKSEETSAQKEVLFIGGHLDGHRRIKGPQTEYYRHRYISAFTLHKEQCNSELEYEEEIYIRKPIILYENDRKIKRIVYIFTGTIALIEKGGTSLLEILIHGYRKQI